MPFLEGVVKEALRLIPPVSTSARCLTEDQPIKEYIIPKGTEVWIFPYGVHHREELFKDAGKFMPERWMEGYEDFRSEEAFSFIPFSAGLRNYIDQRYAMNLTKVLLAHLFRHFSVKLLSGKPKIALNLMSTTVETDLTYSSRVY